MSVPGEKLSLAAFLESENAQTARNEFHQGDVFAMLGARRPHGRVVANLARHPGNALEGSPCQLFQEGMKLAIADDTILTPDIWATCATATAATGSSRRRVPSARRPAIRVLQSTSACRHRHRSPWDARQSAPLTRL